MRRSGMMLALGTTLLLGACAHNDVMVFGTNTTLGLDVQSAPQTGSGPSIVVGYKRQEAVWMPLVVNGLDSRVASCSINAVANTAECSDQPWTPGDAKYTSEVTTTGQSGVEVTQRDVYSVFASLGADFNANAGNTDVGAGGGLAQFFATGNAAINISSNEALVTALKVESAEGAAAQAGAVTAAANNSTTTAIMGGKPATQAELDDGEKVAAAKARRINLVMTCAVAPDGSYRWSQIVDNMIIANPTAKAQIAATPLDRLSARLAGNPALLANALTAGSQAPLSCPGA